MALKKIILYLAKKAPIPYEAYDNESDENTPGYPSGQPKFDEKAYELVYSISHKWFSTLMGWKWEFLFHSYRIQRALIVVAVLAFILLGYLGAKFMLYVVSTQLWSLNWIVIRLFLTIHINHFRTKKRKVDKRYGRIESEIDLLEEMETAESDEEEELFDVNMTRRSNFWYVIKGWCNPVMNIKFQSMSQLSWNYN